LPTKRSDVAAWRHEFAVPAPSLKLSLDGSQATSPAATIFGCETAVVRTGALIVVDVGERPFAAKASR
jgi:hypothetical protein